MADLNTVKNRLQSFLASAFRVELTDRGGFTIRHESAQLFIDVRQNPERPDGPVFINFTCPILFGVQPSPELFEHVATHADDYYFGHLSAFRSEDGSITLFFTHSILGDYLDEQEVVGAVYMLLPVANDLDDALQQQFGGRRFHEDS